MTWKVLFFFLIERTKKSFALHSVLELFKADGAITGLQSIRDARIVFLSQKAIYIHVHRDPSVTQTVQLWCFSSLSFFSCYQLKNIRKNDFQLVIISNDKLQHTVSRCWQLTKRLCEMCCWTRSTVLFDANYCLYLWGEHTDRITTSFSPFTLFIIYIPVKAWGMRGDGPTSSTDFLCLIKLNKQTLCFRNWINNLTLKDNTADCVLVWRTLPPV